MQFTEYELRALVAILRFAEPLIGASILDRSTSSLELGLDFVAFLTPEARKVIITQLAVRDLVDANGLGALKHKAQDALTIAEDESRVKE